MFGLVELEEEDELGVAYAFVLRGGELMLENNPTFAFQVAVGVVGLLIPLGGIRWRGR